MKQTKLMNICDNTHLISFTICTTAAQNAKATESGIGTKRASLQAERKRAMAQM